MLETNIALNRWHDMIGSNEQNEPFPSNSLLLVYIGQEVTIWRQKENMKHDKTSGEKHRNNGQYIHVLHLNNKHSLYSDK